MSASIMYANSKGKIVLSIPIAINLYALSVDELKLRAIYMAEHLADTIKSLRNATLKSNKAGYIEIAFLARVQRKAIKVHLAKIDLLLSVK